MTARPRAPRRRVRRMPPGTAPGTLRKVADAPAPQVRVMAFGADVCEEKTGLDPAQVRETVGRRAVTWIDVTGIADHDAIGRLGAALDLHRLALEDVVHVDQRPKAEGYGDVLFVVARMLGPKRGIEGEQLSLFLGRNFVATFQEEEGDSLEPVRQRIRARGPRLHANGPAYLAYAILDAVVDAYFPVLEKMGDRLEELEDQLLDDPDPRQARELHAMRRELLVLRRSIWPLRDVLATLLREESPLIDEPLRVYYRDCHDHAVRLLDLIESYRELANGLRELYLSLASNRLGEVTQVLTVVATIFIPLSFMAGLWGMNFDTGSSWNMPELSLPFGYPLALGAMGLVAAGMLLFFRKRRWI